MIKVDVTKQLIEFDGTIIEVAKSQRERTVNLCDECAEKVGMALRPLTLRLALTRSLTAITPKRQRLSGQIKFERAELARKIHNNDEVTFDPEDLLVLKEVVGEFEGPEVVLQVWEILGIKAKKD